MTGPDPFELGPERPPTPDDARSPRRPGPPDRPSSPRKFTRFEEEVERMRRPSDSRTPSSGAAFMGILSRTRDIIAAPPGDGQATRVTTPGG